MRNFVVRISPKLSRYYLFIMFALLLLGLSFTVAFAEVGASTDMWGLAQKIIKDVYSKIAGISTILAALMSAVAVIGAKMSNNQHKVDQAWDWLRRIWIAWAVINGIGAFLAYVTPLFEGYASLDGYGG